jgi:hypothetical protein
MIKRAERMQPIRGFGIDRVAAVAEETGGSHGGPILRMENLDTDLPLPPEALEVTRSNLEDPKSHLWASSPRRRRGSSSTMRKSPLPQ